MAKKRYFSYRNIEELQQFLNPHARMYSRKRTGFDSISQRSFAQAVKRARFMGLLPYVKD